MQSNIELITDEKRIRPEKSEVFRLSHKGAGVHSGVYLGHPEFEGFEVIF